VAFAGALAMEPAFLVCDEVTSMLDTASSRTVLDLVAALKAKGIGIIQVTHFLEEAAEADTITILDGGRVAAAGPPDAVLADPDRLSAWGLSALPATVTARELEALGYGPPPVLRVEELLRWAGV
jgi:energy-coupling factor transporter ATP-binding protein EcfA2